MTETSTSVPIFGTHLFDHPVCVVCHADPEAKDNARRVKLNKCSKCMLPYYCSVTCKNQDADNHNLYCQTVEESRAGMESWQEGIEDMAGPPDEDEGSPWNDPQMRFISMQGMTEYYWQETEGLVDGLAEALPFVPLKSVVKEFVDLMVRSLGSGVHPFGEVDLPYKLIELGRYQEAHQYLKWKASRGPNSGRFSSRRMPMLHQTNVDLTEDIVSNSHARGAIISESMTLMAILMLKIAVMDADFMDLSSFHKAITHVDPDSALGRMCHDPLVMETIREQSAPNMLRLQKQVDQIMEWLHEADGDFLEALVDRDAVKPAKLDLTLRFTRDYFERCSYAAQVVRRFLMVKNSQR